LQTTQEAAHKAVFWGLLRYAVGTAEHDAWSEVGADAATAEAAVHRAIVATARNHFIRRSLGTGRDGENRPRGSTGPTG
jgi:hypothetical protein